MAPLIQQRPARTLRMVWMALERSLLQTLADKP